MFRKNIAEQHAERHVNGQKNANAVYCKKMCTVALKANMLFLILSIDAKASALHNLL